MHIEKPNLYVETSFISYLAAKSSGHLVVAANQKVTQEWWESRREDFEIFISDLVIEEVRLGDQAGDCRCYSYRRCGSL